MKSKYTVEQIRQFWGDKAKAYGQSASASWSDHSVIEMEIREIVKRLANGERVLDVGCGNGYSTVQFASQKRISVRGLDYVPQMVEQARLRARTLEHTIVGHVEFDIGDITDLREPSESFDKVVVIRVIINLGTWLNQLKALQECARVLRRGGTLILSEATIQGWQKLNAFRREWGLPDIPMPPFNLYIDQDQVIDAVSSTLRINEVVDYASTYYVGTRVLKPLLIQSLGANIDVANPSMEWNRWFSQLPAFGDYGTQKLFVFQKV